MILTFALSIQLLVSWNQNSEPDVSSYKLYYGTSSGAYTSVVVAGPSAQQMVTLPDGVDYFFAVSAVNDANMESVLSDEAVWRSGLRIAVRLDVDTIEVSWPAEAGFTYRLDSSSDLQSWSPRTLWWGNGGRAVIRLRDVPYFPRQYYRVVIP